MLALLLPVLGPIIAKLVDRIPDPAERERERARLEAEVVGAATAANMAQVELNKIEAGHGSVFVAGWRPFIGWTCGVGLAWAFVGAPVAQWVIALTAPGTTLPGIETGGLFELVLAMLGLGGLRTFDKLKGLTANMPGGPALPAAMPQPAVVLGRPSPPGTTADDLMGARR
jgi:hypothetical protein